MAIQVSVGINPTIHISRFCFGFEGWLRQVPGIYLFLTPGGNIVARKIEDTKRRGERFNFWRVHFVYQNPALMRIVDVFHSQHLPFHNLQTFRAWNGQANNGYSLDDTRSFSLVCINPPGTAHMTHKEGVK